MNITAFGETKPLEQQMEHALRAYPAHMGEDIANIMRAALVTIQCHEAWLAQSDAREAKLMERLDKIERLLQPQERRWWVKGTVYHTPYMWWEDSQIIMAATREDAERLFVEHWNNKSEQHGDSYWATVTHCSGELG